MRARWLGLLLALAEAAIAGQACETSPLSVEALERGSAITAKVRDALEARPDEVVLLARRGQDLDKYGLRYSHVGFVVRDHAHGRWTVIHLLNACGSDDSAIYAQGLGDFFLQPLYRYEARIVWLRPELAHALAQRLTSRLPKTLHQDRYNALSPPDSLRSQNSTAWTQELIVAALLEGEVDRARIHAEDDALGFHPGTVKVARLERIGAGLFRANVDFMEHGVGTRLKGRYPVVTVTSILDALRARGDVVGEAEL